MALSKQVKGQSSVEYLVIVALTFAVIVPVAYLFYHYSIDSTYEIKDSQVVEMGRDIVDSSQAIYYSGRGSKTVLELTVPDNIYNVSIIDGRELIFTMHTPVGFTEVVFFSKVNISGKSSDCTSNVCKLPDLVQPGAIKMKLEAQNENTVTLSTI